MYVRLPRAWFLGLRKIRTYVREGDGETGAFICENLWITTKAESRRIQNAINH